MRQIITIILFLLNFQLIQAQTFEIGGEIGYGKSLFYDHLDFKELFGNSTVNNFKLGFIVSLRPNVTDLVFNSGILFQLKGDNGSSLNYLKIPIGMDVEPGKKLRFIGGGGFYISYLFMTSGSISPDIKNSKSDFQFGSYINIGLKYQILPPWSIFFKIQLDFDLSPLYKESIPDHFGGTNYQNIRSYDFMINLGFKYKIQRKNKNN